jgi:predicted nuclease with TOPRIM domain
MVRHDLKSMPEGELVMDPIEESEALSEKLRAQMQSSERLNEYYNEVVAEIRASLERIEDEESENAMKVDG